MLIHFHQSSFKAEMKRLIYPSESVASVCHELFSLSDVIQCCVRSHISGLQWSCASPAHLTDKVQTGIVSASRIPWNDPFCPHVESVWRHQIQLFIKLAKIILIMIWSLIKQLNIFIIFIVFDYWCIIESDVVWIPHNCWWIIDLTCKYTHIWCFSFSSGIQTDDDARKTEPVLCYQYTAKY